SGNPVTLRIRPSAVNTGVWFRRMDSVDGDAFVPAIWDFAEHSPLCTRLVNADGVSVATVEHLMAGLAGCGINNALVELDGPEVPILDGSAHEFVTAFLDAGIVEQSAPVRAIRILKPVRVENGDAWAELQPDTAIRMDFVIDFDEAAIGHQEKSMTLANGAFVHDLCDSRTFCRNADVEMMRANGLALGGTLENAVVFDKDVVLSPGGLRHSDEPVRHKMLDAMGDLALAGAPIIARYCGHKAGHTLTNMLLRALFDTPDAFETFECDSATMALLPGADVTREDVPVLA
ncbi:MAG: UDP-3-O-acyl-N-acetylglucosamine deacetylase, partial [Planktomarina sp.]